MLAKVGKSDDEAIFTEARGIDGDAQAAVIPALAPERGSSTLLGHSASHSERLLPPHRRH